MYGWMGGRPPDPRPENNCIIRTSRDTIYYSILMESRALGIKMEPNLSQADTTKRPLRTMPSTATPRVARECLNDTQCGLGERLVVRPA
jgi:hypothetical protein